MKGSTRTSPAGNWSKAGGFTLIELAVVMAILAIGVSLTVSLVETAFYGNDLKTSLRRLQGIVNSVRYQAMLDGQDYQLVLEPLSLIGQSGSRYWAAPSSEDEPERPPVKKPLFDSQAVRLLKVEAGRAETSGDEPVRLHYAANGLAEAARFHLMIDGQRRILIQEPFVPKLRLLDEAETRSIQATEW